MRTMSCSGLRELHKKYEKWWLGKMCRTNRLQTFKRVVKIETLGNPSGFTASVFLHYEDGTNTVVPHGSAYKPRKSDIEIES